MFINPVEILDIKENNASEIKKAKKRLFREMELEDGVYDYHGEEITISQVEEAVDSLENNFDAYIYIKELPNLNKFLISGKLPDDHLYFGLKDYEGPDAHDFEVEAVISQVFAERIGAYIKDYSKVGGIAIANAGIYLKMWSKPEHHSIAYTPLKNELKKKVEEIKDMDKETILTQSLIPRAKVIENLPSFFDGVVRDLSWTVRNNLVAAVNLDQEKLIQLTQASRHTAQAHIPIAIPKIKTALNSLSVILNWNTGDKDRFQEDWNALKELHTQLENVNVSMMLKQTTSLSSSGGGEGNFGWVIGVIVVIILLIIGNS